MKTFKSNSFEVQEFEGLNEFARFCENDMNTSFKKYYGDKRISHQESASSTKFCGTASFEEASDLMISGYQEGLKKLKETKTKLTERATQQRPQIKLDVVGFAPCVPNAIIGLPKSMIKREKIAQKTPIINIFYNVSVNGNIDKDVLFEGGKNLLATVKTLEAQGVRVNLKVGDISYAKKDAIKMCSVVIKKAAQSLNPLLVSYPLTHPSFLRRHIFAWEEVSSLTNTSDWVDAYGCAFYAHPMVKGATDGERGLLKREGVLSKNDYYLNAIEAARAESLDDLFRTMGLLKK